MEIIRALDHNRIHFERPEDRAMLHGLLLVVMETVFDGRFKESLGNSAPCWRRLLAASGTPLVEDQLGWGVRCRSVGREDCNYLH